MGNNKNDRALVNIVIAAKNDICFSKANEWIQFYNIVNDCIGFNGLIFTQWPKTTIGMTLQGMAEAIRKFNPSILVKIQPFFLKDTGADESSLVDLLKKDYGYEIFAFNSENSKLKNVESALWDDNYILIHSSKVGHFLHLIQ